MNHQARTFFSVLAAVVCGWAAAPPLYRIDTLAGSGFTGDGRAANAAIFLQPQCVAVDRAGNIYVSDTADHRVRRIGTDGIVRTVAGNGTPGNKGDGGPGPQAQLNAPYGIAVDAAGNVFIADLGNGLVRRVGLDGVIQTWAGGGTNPISAVGSAAARTVRMVQPRDVLVDRGGNLIIADFGAHRVYSVTPGGSLSVIAGTGEPGTISAMTEALKAPLAWPSALGMDLDGVLLIGDSGNRRVRRLGFGYLWTVLDRNRREIEFGTPTGIACDSVGRIYVADGDPTRTAVISPAGDLTAVPVGSTSVAVTPYFEVLTVSERRVRKLSGGMKIEVLAGQGAGDGRVASEWRFSQPSSVLRDAAGAIWVADTGLGRIRKLNTATNELSSPVSSLDSPVSLALDANGKVWAGDRGGVGGVYWIEATTPRALVVGQNRPVVPTALAFDSYGYAYMADAANNLIRRVGPDGSLTVLAGGGRETGDGQGLQLKLAGPAGIAVDASGVVWFSESGTGKLRKIISGRVTTVAGPEMIEPRGMRFDKSGKLWIADAGAHRIVVLEPNGNWYPVAGSGDRGFSGDTGLALAAMLRSPTDVWPDADGSALIADTGNDRIRRIEIVRNEPEPPPVTPQQPPPTGAPITLSPITVLHAATLLESDLAPGQLAYVDGKDMTAPEVTIADQPVRILEASSGRLTILVPVLPPGFAELAVKLQGQLFGKTAVRIAGAVPGILTVAGGKGQALALNSDGTVNGLDNPAARGSVVSLFITGDAGLAPGQTAEIGGYPADVVWSGAAPGLIGITQVNIQTPGGFSPSGAVGVTLAFEGYKTQTGVTIYSR